MTEVVRLVVGLGNPGAGYAAHRHNIGFMVVDELARRRGLTFSAEDPAWAAAAEPAAGLVLLKPLAFMNRSGTALLDWAHRVGIPVGGAPDPEDPVDPGDSGPPVVRPLVVCDDLALPLGSLRLRPRGGSGGQNGLASVIDALGGEEFPRLRLGIAPPDDEVPPAEWADYVLRDFAPDEEETVREVVPAAAAAVACWLEHGLETAVNRFNRRVKAPPTTPEAGPDA